MDSFSDVFERVKQLCRGEMSEVAYDLWIRELELTALDSSTACLQCTTQFKRDIVNEKYNALLTASFEEIMGFPVQVEITSREAAPAAPAAQENNRLDFQPEKEYSFETFVVGPSNKLAYAASVSVAEHPAQNYNPLLIYGDSGLGKTHLIYAIANVIRRNDPRSKIAYVKGDDLTNELVDAIREGKTAEMREKYRQADLLLVDDVQFIAGKKQTQEEFFHTFNTLYESGRQIVLTSDRPPSEMTQLEDRLRTRFEWGLLVDVAPPDFETRLAIVKNKAALLGMELPDKISAYIAENVTANVRQLEGTINKILAYKDLLGNDTDEETVTRAIQDMLRRSNEYVPTPEAILEYISKYYSLDESVIRGQQRVRDAVSARQIAMYLIRSMTNLSLDEIGKVFDNRDHSTVLYSIQQIEKKMKKDAAFAEMVKEIKTNINSKR